MENKIKHFGVVESVDDGKLKVRIVQSSACASCKAAKHCTTSESKEKVIDVYTAGTEFTVGQKVLVMASYKVGFIAVGLAMLVPLVIMTTVLFIMTILGYDELITALSSLLTLIPYYIILFIFRNKINRRVTFGVKKI